MEAVPLSVVKLRPVMSAIWPVDVFAPDHSRIIRYIRCIVGYKQIVVAIFINYLGASLACQRDEARRVPILLP